MTTNNITNPLPSTSLTMQYTINRCIIMQIILIIVKANQCLKITTLNKKEVFMITMASNY